MAARRSRADDRSHDATGRACEWTIESDLLEIQHIVDAVVAQCANAGFSAKQCRFNVPIALTEALANAIVSGNGNDLSRHVHVRAVIDGAATPTVSANGAGAVAAPAAPNSATLWLDITDEGPGFDLGVSANSPDDEDWLEREDGRGIFLMRQLMDRVECVHRNGAGGHTVRLVLHKA